MDRVEDDVATQQTIEMLVELSIDSLDMIALALSELLDSISNVSSIFITLNKKSGTIFLSENRPKYWTYYHPGPSISTFHFEVALPDNGVTLDSTVFLIRFFCRHS